MKIIKIMLSAALLTMMMAAMSLPVLALDQGAYSVYAGTSYWNPDTGEIDDGGTANAALGDGMSRSVTGASALVEREGDSYYVTIRLLLQSSTYDAQFWTRTDYNSYQAVEYDIMAENAVTDSMDYRFAVEDPFQPIQASMYVVPMGRTTLWYIQLDESSVASDTGDFIVTVQTVVPQEMEEEVTVEEVENLQLEESEAEEQDTEIAEPVPSQEQEVQVEESEPVGEEIEAEQIAAEEIQQEEQRDLQDDAQSEHALNMAIVIIIVAAIVAVAAAVVLGRKRGGR